MDIDGADEAVFGRAQFTERDVIAGEETEVDIGDADDLRNLVAGPRSTDNAEIENEVAKAREAGDMQAMQTALGKRGLNIVSYSPSSSCSGLTQSIQQDAITASTSFNCRICLDVYVDPTVSTGCWHTCCSECWLRCLGSTKLCPICKRITGVSELRRIYL